MAGGTCVEQDDNKRPASSSIIAPGIFVAKYSFNGTLAPSLLERALFLLAISNAIAVPFTKGVIHKEKSSTFADLDATRKRSPPAMTTIGAD